MEHATSPDHPRRRCIGAALAAAMLATPAAFAQGPSGKVLRIIVPTPSGGAADVVARLLADGLQKELNRPVIVESKPGAGGTLAVSSFIQAPHDGDTVLVGPNATVSEVPHIVKSRIDMAKEIKRVPNWRAPASSSWVIRRCRQRPWQK